MVESYTDLMVKMKHKFTHDILYCVAFYVLLLLFASHVHHILCNVGSSFFTENIFFERLINVLILGADDCTENCDDKGSCLLSIVECF